MKQTKSLYKSESGVIHHLGLFILAAFVVVGVGFAVFKVVDSNKSNDSAVTINVDENSDSDAADADVTKEVEANQNDANSVEEVTPEAL